MSACLLYPTCNSIPSYNSLMALMGPFIGIFMGFDAINSERTEGTLNRLVSQPLYRDQIIVSKFLAGLFISAVMVFASGLLIGSVGLIATGLIPSGEEVARLFIYLCFCVIRARSGSGSAHRNSSSSRSSWPASHSRLQGTWHPR